MSPIATIFGNEMAVESY